MAGNELTVKNVSLDHVIPKSQGGTSTTGNYVLATRKFNNLRGVIPLALLITKEMFDTWAEQFEKLTVCGIPGPEYTKMIFDKIWTSAK